MRIGLEWKKLMIKKIINKLDKTIKMKKLIILLMVLFIIPFSFSSSNVVNDTEYTIVGLNTSLFVIQTIYYDSVDVNNSYIYFGNLNMTTGSERLNYSVNMTVNNSRYYYNGSVKDLPYISSSSGKTRVIPSGLDDNVNATAIFTFPCSLTEQTEGDYDSISCNTCTVSAVCSATNTVSVNITDLIKGDNVITIKAFGLAERQDEICDNYFTNLLIIVKWIGTIFIFGIVLMIAGMILGGIRKYDEFDKHFVNLYRFMLFYVLGFGGLAIIIAVSSIVAGVLCSLNLI